MNVIRRSRCGRLRLSGRIGDVFKTPPRRQRTLIPRRKLRYDLTIGMVSLPLTDLMAASFHRATLRSIRL